MVTTDIKTKAIREFRQGDRLEDIAVRAGVSKGTVSIWAKGAGARKRQRGCRVKTMPSAKDLAILTTCRTRAHGKPTFQEIADQWGMTRAGVHRVYTKWKDKELTYPFKPGDKVRFQGRDYTLITAGLVEGKAVDCITGQRVNLPWQVDGDRVVKL
jgi:transposase